MNKISILIDKYSRREFWPMQLAYLPGVFQWLVNSIKSKSFIYPLWVNNKPFGRIASYSKYEIGKILPKELIYKTDLYIHTTQKLDPLEIWNLIESNKFTLPFVIKPDYGERGKGVIIIKDKTDFNKHITESYLNFWDRILIQEYATETIEVGIGYAYDPKFNCGITTGMVVKEFLHVVGDGRNTIGELLKIHPRGHFYIEFLKQTLFEIRDLVLPMGEGRELLSIGNHVKGSTFYDKSDQISPSLSQKIIQISQSIPGFYFGRYDLRAKSWDSLMSGEFKIIELNGADSEPTRIYDPDYRFWQGRKALRKRQTMIYKISDYRKSGKDHTIGKFLDEMYEHHQYLPDSITTLLRIRKNSMMILFVLASTSLTIILYILIKLK